MPWVNGLGTTAVIAQEPVTGDGTAWLWRLSLADVTNDGPFSSLPGIDRWIAVATGAGMELTVGHDRPVVLRAGNDAFAFSGDDDTVCCLLDGPIVDVNLMLRRGRVTGALRLHDLGAGDLLGALGDDGEVAVVVLSGEVRAGDVRAAAFDAWVGQPPATIAAISPARVAVVEIRDLRGAARPG